MQNKVINLFGSPTVGKSTLAAWLFSKLKIKYNSVELITEKSKELSYDHSNAISDYVYILGEQYHKMFVSKRMKYMVTDIPLLQLIMYYNISVKEHIDFIFSLHNEFNNVNFFLKRNSISHLNTIYHNMTTKIEHFLRKHSIPYVEIDLENENSYDFVLKQIEN